MMAIERHPNTNLRGLISATQRFSIHDGPGIRTLVFMKGCPLGCLWCSNPETQQFKPQLFYNSNCCIGCANCLAACPDGAINLAKGGKPRTDRKLCKNCGTCVQVCPSGARTMVGKYMSVEELLEEVKKDSPFYQRSGGGVTVGGGEPAMQPYFVAELLRRSKLEHNMNTAVETCGFADYSAIQMILRYADLVFYDIKHIDSSIHRTLTGVSNEVILDNIRRLVHDDARKKIIVRIPVIPGYNDSEETIRSIGAFIAGLGESIVQIELLPYHNYGASKYVKLGRRYKPGRLQLPASEHLSRLKQIVIATGVNARIGNAA